jgi:putative salt-induced outer membrane protein YdiY
LGGEVTHRTDIATTRGSGAFLTSETDAVTRARSLTLRARHGIRVSERVELFGEGSYSRDRFAGIGNRATTTAGAAYTASPSPRQRFTMEGSMGFTAERRLDATRLRFATATGAAGYAWTFARGVELTEDVGLIADLATAGNWRGTTATAVSVALTRLLSLKASHAIEYRNTAVAGFGRTDMRTAAALVVSVQRPNGP